MKYGNIPFNSVYTRKSIPKNTLSLYDSINIDPSWKDSASCKSSNTSDYFPLSKKSNLGTTITAINLCHYCPVSHFCAYEAMKYNYDGVWGASLYPERLYFIRTELDNDLDNLTLKLAKKFIRSITSVKYRSHRTKGRKPNFTEGDT